MSKDASKSTSPPQHATPPDARFPHEDPFLDAAGNPRRLRGAMVLSGSPRVAELAARVGFDTLWIELEHATTLGFQQAEQLAIACTAGGAVPTIRTQDAQRTHILRALEIGARMIVVPMVNTAEIAKQVVEFGRFPPAGKRGYNTLSRGLEYGQAPTPVELLQRANRRIRLFAQIETAEALDNLESILAVEGLDGVFVGPGDLSVALGCTGDMANPKLIAEVERVIATAHQHHKKAALLVAPGPMLDSAVAAGVDLVFYSSDLGVLGKQWAEHEQLVPSQLR